MTTRRLILLRHAKSGWDAPVERDFDRPLNERGRRAAGVVGAAAKASGLAIDALIASPAARVRETLDSFLPAAGFATEAAFEQRLYLASSATILEVVAEVDAGVATLLVAGHNPGLEDLVLHLTPADAGAERAKVEDKFPTAALAVLALDAPGWDALATGSARFERLILPRELDPGLGPED